MMRRSSSSVDMLFTVSLFFLFAFCAIAVIILGAGSYRRAAQGLEREFTVQTAVSYVTEKIHACGESSTVSAEEWDGGSLLRIGSILEGKPYNTYIYCNEGKLYELLLPRDRAFSPQAGQQLMELSGFSATWSSHRLLEISFTGNQGQTISALLYTPCATREAVL